MTLHSVIVMFACLHTHYHYRENTVLTVVIYESYTSFGEQKNTSFFIAMFLHGTDFHLFHALE